MVGPSLSDEDRQSASRRLRVGFVVLVGASAGLVALQAGADLTGVGVAALGGVVLGLLLAAFLSRWAREFAASGGKRGRRR